MQYISSSFMCASFSEFMVLDYHKHTREIYWMYYMHLGYMHQSRKERMELHMCMVILANKFLQASHQHAHLQDAYTYLEVP
jgi:hypothetical protein